MPSWAPAWAPETMRLLCWHLGSSYNKDCFQVTRNPPRRLFLASDLAWLPELAAVPYLQGAGQSYPLRQVEALHLMPRVALG